MRSILFALAALPFVLVQSSLALQVGDEVPNIALPTTAGGEARLGDFKGKWLVVYFYPKSFTSGCTTQACSLRDEYGDIQKRGAKILGVSTDSIETQYRFKKEYHLPFDLLSDHKKELAKAFDSMMAGGLLASRKTFLINPEGKVAKRFDKVSTAHHAEEVIKALDALMTK